MMISPCIFLALLPIGSNNPMNSSIEHREVELDSSRLRSKVWPHFKRQKINGQIKTICIYCNFSLHGGSRYGTSHLKNHLNRCRKSKLVQIDLKQYQRTSSKGDSGKDIIASYVYDQNVAKKKLAHMIRMHEYLLSMFGAAYPKRVLGLEQADPTPTRPVAIPSPP
ncbi:hypothetical protein ACOSQ2_020985 [Xanthoceras sorbifolium]